MKKKILFGSLIFVFISALVFAGSTGGVTWSGNSITASSTDGKTHVLDLAITITNVYKVRCISLVKRVPPSVL